MSVEQVQRSGGTVWRVRWRDAQGKPHSKVIGRKADAVALDQELKRAKRLGAVAPIDASRETLGEFTKVWWSRHVAPNLERHTREGYASILDVHLIPALGDVALRSITTEVIGDLRADMFERGVGAPTIRKTLVILQSILERAVEWRRLESNPARAVRKPGQQRTRVVRPLAPRTIERIRAYLLHHGLQLDATLVAVLAYAGLRPGEAIGLRWHDVGARTLLVERSVAFGQLKTTKTGKTRSVKLLPPLIETLDAWHNQTPRNAPTDLVFPSPDGSPWNADRARNWRKHTFRDAATAAGVPNARPYDLRHSWVSLLIAEGATVVEVAARQAGHAPTVTLDTYAHLFDELHDVPVTSADRLIREARAAEGVREVSVLCPRPDQSESGATENPCKSAEPASGIEPETSSLQVKCSAN